MIYLSSIQGLCVLGLQKPHNWKCSQKSSKISHGSLSCLESNMKHKWWLSFVIVIFTNVHLQNNLQKHSFKNNFLFVVDHNKLQKYSPWLQKVPSEHLMTRLSKLKNPNCLTVYINWPVEMLELRWNTLRVAIVFFFTALCFSPSILSDLEHSLLSLSPFALLIQLWLFSPVIHTTQYKGSSHTLLFLFTREVLIVSCL